LTQRGVCHYAGHLRSTGDLRSPTAWASALSTREMLNDQAQSSRTGAGLASCTSKLTFPLLPGMPSPPIPGCGLSLWGKKGEGEARAGLA
jgi:hypothetical protein